ncbi:MAG: hypothetical protein TU35_004990 [Thermoproteus sp. AZ2]|uniref:Uncharacterized protein n=1 Tax=Thermoproteus sp. AZ2 TaxID=1609232 RepID=A0ACC6V1F4_9CREN
MESSPSRGSEEPLLSIVTSPYVKSITLIKGGKAFLLQYYPGSRDIYAAVVAKGREERIDDEGVVKAARALTKLMRFIGKAVKSRYYSFTGTIKAEGEALVFKPYISPISTALVAIRGNRIVVEVPNVLKKRLEARVDVAAAIRYILRRLNST